MPFYEYQCTHCGHTLEAMQKFTDAPLKKCPHCGKPQLQKLMSAPVFRLKGGGWYETDFKSEQDNKRNLADRPEAAASKETDKTEAASKETAASDTPKPEKSAEKPVDKAVAAEGGKKAATASGSGAAGGVARRPSAAKSNARKAAKRPARPAMKRSAAKPARGR